MKKNIFVLALCIGCMLFGSTAFAELVTGRAYIENGNVTKARVDARKDAMRSFVEEQVGVNVKSTTEVVDNMLVRDSIISKSDGFVSVKRVVKEQQLDDIYEVVLDLEASRTMIQTAAQDVATQLQLLEDDSSRSGIQVAIVDDNTSLTGRWNAYFAGVLKQVGFRSEVNDDVLLYLAQHLNHVDDLALNAEVRRIGRMGDRGAANSIIRGRVGLARRAEPVAGGNYRAVASINAELVGYDNNMTDVYAGHYTAVSPFPDEAERMAKEAVLKAAAEELGRQALLTTQREYRGGVHQVKATLVFDGIMDKVSQRPLIVKGLNGMNCRIIRSGFLPNGRFQAFVEATDYNNLEELKEAVLQELGKTFYSITESFDEGNTGSTKLYFDLRG